MKTPSQKTKVKKKPVTKPKSKNELPVATTGLIYAHKLRGACKSYLKHIGNKKTRNKPHQFEQEIFEHALEALYGKKVWVYIDQQLNNNK